MKVYSYNYDLTYDPAIPVVEVHLVSPESGEAVGPITAVVDSGADGTTIPTDLLEQIGALSIGTGIMSGIWGERQVVNIYLVRLEIGPYALLGVRVAGVPNSVGFVLGRNILNHMAITLNGPATTTEIIADE
jgi:predicted aspartyl protease